VPYNGRIPKEEKLRRVVGHLLAKGGKADHVIALTDVYTGSSPPDFIDAEDAKLKMRQWVGDEKRFHPHAAQHDFEAWLLPYWPDIQRLAGSNRTAPAPCDNPEGVNHLTPPSYHIKEVFRTGRVGKAYIKPRDAGRILRENDLSVAIAACPQLKSFVDTILAICGAPAIL
jgi:hypothetical protein